MFLVEMCELLPIIAVIRAKRNNVRLYVKIFERPLWLEMFEKLLFGFIQSLQALPAMCICR